MSRTVIILYWLIGQGFVFQLICKIKAVPTTSSTTQIPILSTEPQPASENQSTTVAIDTGGQSVEFIDAIVNSSSTGNSSSMIAFNNETKTSSPGVIPERWGKAMDFGAKLLATPEEPSEELADNSTATTDSINATSTSTSLPEIGNKNDTDAPSELTAKLAKEEDQVIEPVGDVDADAPPKSNIELSTTKRPKLKPIEVKRVDLVEPRFLYVESTKAPANERDRMIQDIFGGECTHEIWNKCNRITYWGGDYVVPDKRNPGETIVKHHKIKCVESPSSTVCLKNGWSVARCHMLCMSQCNIEYRLNYEDLVLHDGACRFPLLLKK